MKKFFLIAMIGLSFASCKKDSVDPRDQMVGSYSGTITATANGNTTTTDVLVTIAKNTSNSDEIIITDVDKDGNTVYKGNGITIASNGCGFNLPQQTVVAGGYVLSLTGFPSATIGAMKYDGFYDKTTSKLTFSSIGTINANGNSIPYAVTYSVSK